MWKITIFALLNTLIMKFLHRKIDIYLKEWKKRNHKPLIVKGARQIGKTSSIMHFASTNYDSVIALNFVLQSSFKQIFDNGYEVENIIKNITLINPDFRFIPYKTLIFFDEIQDCPQCATCLKAFAIDGRFDVICSGSLMGINYREIESNSVGYKEDYEMYSLDFEEFLWAKGYGGDFIDSLLEKMKKTEPLSSVEMNVLGDAFREYMIIGGMPAIVSKFMANNNFEGTLQMQRQLLLDYEEDITKYAGGLDKGKILSVYRKIPAFLGKDNKKFQISKIARNARNRDYVGTTEWLDNAGIINICHCLELPELPLKGNYDPKQYKLYYKDTGLLIASLDQESQEDLRSNNNLGTYKGALFENIVGDMLVKQGYDLYFYRQDKPSIEMDFFVRNADSLIPVEVKANNSVSPSLNKLVNPENKYSDIRFGIKLCAANIGFNGRILTLPYFTTFMLRRFLKERKM